MKLLYCTECNDVFALGLEARSCRCGKTVGQYTDQTNAVYEGSGIPLGINNIEFRGAINARKRHGAGYNFSAFVIRPNSPTIKKKL